MRILSKQKNHLLQFLNSTRKFITGVAIDRSSLHIPTSRVLLESTDYQPKILRIWPDENCFAFLSGESWDHHPKILLKIWPDGNRFAFLSGEKFERLYRLPCRLPICKEALEIAPSCKGLLHLYSTSNLEGAVWNPRTAEFKPIPSSDVPNTERSGPILSALGFDSKAQEYKLLRVVDHCIKEEYIELYSFKTDSWKEIFTDDGRRVKYSKPSVYANGCLYWNGVDRILSFDFAEERFSSLCWPPIANGLRGPYEFKLVEFDGLLACILCPVVETHKTLELWVMEGDGLWSKQFTIGVSSDLRLVGFLGNDRFLFLEKCDVILMYDCSTNKLKKHDYIYGIQQATEFIPYVESKLLLADQLATSDSYTFCDYQRDN